MKKVMLHPLDVTKTPEIYRYLTETSEKTGKTMATLRREILLDASRGRLHKLEEEVELLRDENMALRSERKK